MMSAASQDTFGPSGWNQGPRNPGPPNQDPANQGPWGNTPYNSSRRPGGGGANGPWGCPPFWHPAGISRPAAIAFTILGFLFWWPVGLAILFYMLGSGRMGCFGRRRRAMYQQAGQNGGPWGSWMSWACGGDGRAGVSSGNRAFDEYKAETLRRMEEEQKEFASFLERLRFAKDKAEFDAFMAERRARPPAPPAEEQPGA
jgi:hypothetical protein